MKKRTIFTIIIAAFIFAGTARASLFDFFFQKPETGVQLIQVIGDLADLQNELERRVAALETSSVRLGAGSTVETIEQWRATTSPYSAIGTRINAKNIYAPFSHATTSALTATNIYGTGSSTINVLNVNTCNGCPGSGAVTGSGSANRLAYWDSGSSISSDADFTINAATGNLTATYASTTFITATYGSTTALTISGNSYLGTVSSGVWNGTAIANAFVDDDITLTNITQITNRDITSLTTAAGAGAVYFSSGAVPAVDATNLIFNDTLNRLTFTYGTTTFLTATYGSSTALTAGNLFSTNASSTYISTSQNVVVGNTLVVPNLTSAAVITGAAGIFEEYAGTSCTNQFVRSLSALIAGTCATVVAGDVDLADLTATNGTLTFSGAYDGQTARTIGLNLASSNEWTASTTISAILNVEALSLTASGTISILNTNTANMGSTTAQTLNANAINANDAVIKIRQYPAFSIATTSWTGTTTIPLGPAFVAETWNSIQCFTDVGTLDATITDGSASTSLFRASTTVGVFSFGSTNNTFTVGEKRYLNIGTPASSPTKISCTVDKTINQ